MSKNDYSANTIKYITNVKRYLKQRYGKVNDEWNGAIEILADNVELYLQCRNSIFKEGLMMTAKNGAPTRHPLIKTMINFVGDDDEELKELLG